MYRIEEEKSHTKEHTNKRTSTLKVYKKRFMKILQNKKEATK